MGGEKILGGPAEGDGTVGGDGALWGGGGFDPRAGGELATIHL